MSRLAVFLLLCLGAEFAHGMDCSITLGGSKSFLEKTLEKTLNSCPGLLDSNDKSYCCIDFDKETAYCCNYEEFILKTGLGIVLPLIITGIVVISLIVCCVSCLCCSCCPWYRRRHQGTVYGKVQAPNTVVHHVIQTPANIPPSYAPQKAQAQNVSHPTNPAGFSQHPPPYSNEGYTKQAPYNPAYPQQ